MGAVRWYCPRAKDEKRQKQLGLDVQAVFHNPSECNKLHPPSHLSVRSVLLHFVQRSPPETRTLYKGGKKVYLFYTARFSHFIDSLKRWRNQISNAFTYALIKLSLRILQFQTHYIFFLLLLFGKPVKPFKFLFKYKQQINCTECPT